MRNKKPVRPLLIENLSIHSVAAEGKGIGRSDNFVVFVEGAVPGDVVDARVLKKKKDYALAEIERLIVASPERTVPFCSHFGTCGGCKWQQVSYEQQLKFKTQIVEEAFRRIAKTELKSLQTILGCEHSTHYRNKLEFTFSDRVWLTREQIESGEVFNRNALGFHAAGSFSAVIQIDTCYLMDERVNTIRNAVYHFAKEHQYSFYNLKFHEGLMRNLIFRCSTLDEWMLTVCFAEEQTEQIRLMMEFLKMNFPYLTSLNYIINRKKNDTIYDQEVITYHGRDHIIEQLGDIRYKISTKSFFQTNSRQAKRLYDVVRDFGDFQKAEVVYDLYCGTGSIGLYIADSCKKVVGIEQVPESIGDAKANAALNGISNSVFHAGTCESILNPSFIETHGSPDTVIVDPPRSGLHEDVIRVLLQALPQKIVYVSCNPATQARDVLLLSERYRLSRCRPVDMFPHTYHIENVVLLEKQDQGASN